MNVTSASESARRYLDDLGRLIGAVDEKQVQRIVDVLDAAHGKGARVFVIGNGGSAATASHFVSDLGIGLKRRKLAEFDIVSLGDNHATCTAIANDLSYDEIFSAQLQGQIRADDVLIAISASGNSPNIVRAVEVAKAAQATVVGLSGFDGGRLRRLADVSFHVETPDGAYGLVEDLHMIVNHMLYTHYAERG